MQQRGRIIKKLDQLNLTWSLKSNLTNKGKAGILLWNTITELKISLPQLNRNSKRRNLSTKRIDWH